MRCSHEDENNSGDDDDGHMHDIDFVDIGDGGVDNVIDENYDAKGK